MPEPAEEFECCCGDRERVACQVNFLGASSESFVGRGVEGS